jgi:hypothetical protein
VKHLRFSILMAATAFVALASTPPVPAAPGSIPSGAFAGCPARGVGGDPELNHLKNRSSAPAVVGTITVSQMKQLPRVPARTPAMRAAWPVTVRSLIGAQEARAVVFTGYIVRVNHETGDPSNCGSTLPRDEDVELFLAAHPGARDATRIILGEVTPRWRAVYASWRTADLRTLGVSTSRVRITGWLLYDEESWHELGGGTATPWEIEPITRVQVWRNGGWADY